MPYVTRIIKIFAFALLLATNAIAQEVQYMRERPTKRVALVIGNSIYDNAERIDSAKVDAEQMTKMLRSLQFEVIDATNVEDVETFYVRYLDRFLSKIGPGDFAVVYFSGHGMSYGRENFLATTRFPKTVPEAAIADHFLSVQGLRRLTTARNPGFVLILLDACRNIGAFVKKPDEDAPVLVPKGLGQERIDDTNVVLGFATDDGGVSFGSNEPGAMSIYTEAVVEMAPVKDRELGEFFRHVRFYVKNKTENSSNRQIPWRSDSNTSEIYFMPSEKILEQERKAWEAALKSNSPDDVKAFLSFYSTSRYADAARLWLNDNEARERPSTKVLPTTLERAWTGPGGRASPVARFDGPFSLPRRTSVTAEIVGASMAASAAASTPRSDVGSSQGLQARVGADVLLSTGTTTLTASLPAREAPSASAREVATVPSGTTVKVEDVVWVGPLREPWLRVRLPQQASSVFLSANRIELTSFDVGISLMEIEVPPIRDGLKTLVDPEPINGALASLKQAGKSINRVSISSPTADDPKQVKLLAARMNHAALILEQADIARSIITSVRGAATGSRENVKVRFFGQ